MPLAPFGRAAPFRGAARKGRGKKMRSSYFPSLLPSFTPSLLHSFTPSLHQPVFLIPAAIPLIVNNAPRSNSPLL